MSVAVMDIGPMGMRMNQPRVRMLVTMGAGCVHARGVFVVVVRISVAVQVAMGQGFVRVPMIVMLGDVQPRPDSHQRRGGQQQRRDRNWCRFAARRL